MIIPKRPWQVLAILAALSLLAGACSGAEDASDSTDETAQTEVEQPPEVAETGAEAAQDDAAETEEPTEPETGADLPDEPVPVEVIYNSDSVSIPEYPTYLAWEALAADGVVDVTYTFVADAQLGIQSLLQGDADWVHASAPVFLPANAQAEDISAFVAWKRQGWSIVTGPEITEISGISGNTLGVHAQQSFTNTVAQLVIEENDLTDVEVVFIEGSEVRAQALAAGELDATVLDISDVITLQQQGLGDELNILLSLGELFPNQTNGRWVVSDEWVAENEAVAVRIAQEMIRQNRMAYEDTDALVESAVAYFDDVDPATVEAIIQAYVDREIWTTDGLLTPEVAMEEIAFYADAGLIDVEPTEENVERAYATGLMDQVLSGLEDS